MTDMKMSEEELVIIFYYVGPRNWILYAGLAASTFTRKSITSGPNTFLKLIPCKGIMSSQ